MVWFTWNQDSSLGLDPVIGDILQTGVSYDITSPLNRINLKKKRFTLMYDRVFTVNNYNPSIFGELSFFGKRLPFKDVEYQPGGTTGNNQIWMLIVTDSTAPANPTIEISGRLTFTDV